VELALEGYLDSCTSTIISGWAWDNLNPDGHVIVEIAVDEEPLAQISAGEYRKDLKDAGLGAGFHGYSYIPSISIDPVRQRISVAIADGEKRVPLSFSASAQTLHLHEQAKLAGWFHSIDLGGGHFTNGHKSPECMKAEAIGWELPTDFSGKTVLDIKRLRTKTRELAIIETHVDDSVKTDIPLMVYYETDECGNDPTNWWGPNIPCLEAMLRTAGFQATKVYTLGGSEYERVAYHCRPINISLYSEIVDHATNSQNMAEEYKGRMFHYLKRIQQLERQIADLQQRPAVEAQIPSFRSRLDR
jgi:hypothetical protein